MNQELVDYINEGLKHGLTESQVKQNLLDAGWEASLIEQNFVYAKAAENKAAIVKDDIQKTSPVIQPAQPVAQPAPNISPHLSPIQPAKPVATMASVQTQSPQVEAQPAAVEPVTAKRSIYKNPFLWIAIIVLLLIGGGAFAFFNFSTPTAAKVFNNFLSAKRPSIYTNDYSFTYSFVGDATLTTTPTNLTLSGKLYSDTTNPSNPQFSNDLNIASNYPGIININYSFPTLYLNGVLYVNIASLSGFFGSEFPSGWIQIDLNELQTYLQQSDPQAAQDLTSSLNSNKVLQSQIKQIWQIGNIAKPTNYLAKEQLNGVPVYHLQVQIDPSAVASDTIASMKAIYDNSTTTQAEFTPDQMASADQILTAIAKKFTVKKFDIWIGQKDNQLYKLDLSVSMPGPNDVSSNDDALANMFSPLADAREKSREAKRIADMRQMASALELYQNDHNGYPSALNGSPVGLTPSYIGIIPTAPTPADGSCTDFYNGYWYKASGTPTVYQGTTVYPSYTMTFCLGSPVGGYQAGIAMLTPSGISDNISCPTTAAQCVNSNPASNNDTAQVVSEINALNFTASGELTFSFSNFGKSQTLTAPADSQDLVQALTQVQGQSADAKRIADIRQFASAFELYYNDKGTYPDQLTQLSPNYFSPIPTAPPPTSSLCTASQNTYTYTKVSANEYTLTFCLGSDAGSYSAGPHTLTPEGIK